MSVFTEKEKRELVKYILLMESSLFELTLTDFCKLAYKLAVHNNIPHSFNDTIKTVGKD